MAEVDVRFAAALWNKGKGTYDIAKLAGLPEHIVFASLSKIKRVAKEMRNE